MPLPRTVGKKVVLALVVILSLTALALTIVMPSFGIDNELVYGGF
jgi:hypothetical protein